jgi:hypothetical protein
MAQVQHTPLKWSQVYFPKLTERHIRYYSEGIAETIAVMQCGDFDTDQANAELIVKSCNNHDFLVETLKEISEGKGRYSTDQLTHANNTIEDMKKLALEAIAVVEGKIA